jgi:hypothetical protein
MVLLRAGLSVLPPNQGQPVFCVVRNYEGFLVHPLSELGFEAMAEQALMVKYMAARVQAAAGEAVAALKQGAEPAAPTLTHATEAER